MKHKLLDAFFVTEAVKRESYIFKEISPGRLPRQL